MLSTPKGLNGHAILRDKLTNMLNLYVKDGAFENISPEKLVVAHSPS